MEEKTKKNITMAFNEKLKELFGLRIDNNLSEEEFNEQKGYAESARNFVYEKYNLVSSDKNQKLTSYESDKRLYDCYFNFIKNFYPTLESCV